MSVGDTERVLLVLLAVAWLVAAMARITYAYRVDERKVTSEVHARFAALAVGDLLCGWLVHWPGWIIPAIPAFVATLVFLVSHGHPVRVFPPQYVRDLSSEQVQDQQRWASITSRRLAWVVGLGILGVVAWFIGVYITLWPRREVPIGALSARRESGIVCA